MAICRQDTPSRRSGEGGRQVFHISGRNPEPSAPYNGVMADPTGPNPFQSFRAAAARQAWSSSTNRMRGRFSGASLAERAVYVLAAAVTLGLLLLILIPAALLGILVLVVAWTWLTIRGWIRRLRGTGGSRRDQSLRRNVRVIRR